MPFQKSLFYSSSEKKFLSYEMAANLSSKPSPWNGIVSQLEDIQMFHWVVSYSEY